ncbi:MAG TPA: methylated-DNA--[protein]-cysteine S-methyltransferase [Methylophilaceae bacterium]|jgi:methylated-DNA-[protein]-cysteine S-methyltransferase
MTTEVEYQACIPFSAISLGIRCSDKALLGIDFLPHDAPAIAPTNAFARKVCQVLNDYLQQPSQPLDVAVIPQGTAFQQRVWQEICRIPLGQTITYGELAKRIHSGPRAVANACGANKTPLIVPCHRVVASNGIGGFMQGKRTNALHIKRWLLAHEGAL